MSEQLFASTIGEATRALTNANATTSTGPLRKGLWTVVAMIAAMAIASIPSIAMAEPAPPLTAIWVCDVASPAYNGGHTWDPVKQGAISVPSHQAGPWLAVVVFEYGYGQASQAFYNGQPMQLYDSEPYVVNGYFYGWYRYYYINHNINGGAVTAQSTSINGNHKTLSTRLNVW